MLCARAIILAAALTVVGALAGCLSPEDWHKVPVPKVVQDATGAPAEVSRADYANVWRPQYEEAVKAQAEKAKAEREAEAATLATINQQKQEKAEREVRTVRRSAAAQIAAITTQAEQDAELVADRLAGELAAAQLAERTIEKSYAATIEKIRADASKALARGDAEAAAAERKFQTTMSLITLGTDAIGTATVGTPYGGLIAIALGTLGGLFIRKPGDQANVDALKGTTKGIEALPDDMRARVKEEIAKYVKNPKALVAITEAKTA